MRPFLDVLFQIQSHRFCAGQQDSARFVKGEPDSGIAFRRHLSGKLKGERGFAGAGRAKDEGCGSAIHTATEQIVERFNSA